MNIKYSIKMQKDGGTEIVRHKLNFHLFSL